MRKKALPFSVSRDDARSLVDQVADGLREAIVSGHWAVGDEIPSSRELVPMLGVSRIVTKAAIARLAAEGYVAARLGMKTVVRDRGAKKWKGHVVFVYKDTSIGFYQTAFAESLRVRLNREGYLFSRATVTGADNDADYDYSLVDASLSRSADLVLAATNRLRVFRHLARCGVPFAPITNREAKPYGAVGFTHFDALADFGAMSESCLRAGVRKALVFRWMANAGTLVNALRNAGIDAREIRFRPATTPVSFVGIEKAGFDGFARLIASGRIDRDTLCFFDDDYLARGALTAMLYAGLKAPEDIRVATWSNAGFEPIYGRDLSRMEMDPVASGATVAEAALAYLKTGQYPAVSVVGPKWIAGETLGAMHTAECTMQNAELSRASRPRPDKL